MKTRILFGLVLITVFLGCTPRVYLVSISDDNQKTTAESPADQSVEAMIQPYKIKMEKEMNVVIGVFENEMTKEKPESTLGNFVADLTYNKMTESYEEPIDFAIMNYGGLRVPSIPAGKITKGDVFELMPFDNILVVMTLDGSTVLQIFELMAGHGGWPISKQVRYQIKDGKPQNIEINQQPLSLSKSYRVAISDYLANGGDKLSFLKDKPRESNGLLLREAILQYIEDQGDNPISAPIDGRVLVVE